jgi:NAD(P)-dependent dehydrogenase (short-subunit alcohol dehydrogenase family)
MSLAGKRVLIVGASSGIGHASALLLARSGAHLALAARRLPRLEAAARDAGGGAIALACDVRDPGACEAAVIRAAETLGGLDGIVYAAGASALTRLDAATADDWRLAFETNVLGAALVTRAALPHLLAARGRAVYLASIAAWDRPPRLGLGLYMTTKAALEKMIEVWRAENRQVGFTSIVLGDTVTEFGAGWDRARVGAFVKDWAARGQLFERAMAPESVAAQVLHALSSAENVDQIVILPRPPATH